MRVLTNIEKDVSDTYRPDIDGLRAVAVALVVAYHAFPGVFKGGFIGVDIFFVISGYLISKILIDIIYYKKSSLSIFFQRRIRRLFPSLLVILFFCFFLGWFYFTASEFEYLGKHLLASASFTSNLILMSESGYFDIASDKKPLLHLWSLAIEEQYYIFFPIFIYFLIKRNINLFKGVLYLSLLSLLCGITLTIVSSTLGFFLPFTRIWELQLGALLTIVSYNRHLIRQGHIGFMSSLKWVRINPLPLTSQQIHKLANLRSLVGVATILAGVIYLDGSGNLPPAWNLIPCFGAVLIITAGPQAWLNKAMLSHSTFTWLGKISYPLYLWHWPLLSIGGILLASRPSAMSRITIVAISLVLSQLLYVTVERWFRHGGQNTLKVSVLVTLMAIVGLLGCVTMSSNGFSERPIAVQYSKISEAVIDWHPFDHYSSLEVGGQRVKTPTPSRAPSILFIGDSHMEQFGPTVQQLSADQRLRPSLFLTSGGCPPIPNVFERTSLRCENSINAINDVLRAAPTIDTIVVGACWNCYFGHETLPKANQQSKFEYYYQTATRTESFRGQQGAPLALKSLQEYLTQLAVHYKVFLLLDNPLGDQFNPASELKNRLSVRQSADVANIATIDDKQLRLNEYLKQIAHDSGALVLDQIEYLCSEKQCTRLNTKGLPIYKDDHHLRPFFAREMIKVFNPLTEDANSP